MTEMPLDIYKPSLQQVAVARMVRQLSEVYSIIRVSTMSELAPFIGFGQVRPCPAGSSCAPPRAHGRRHPRSAPCPAQAEQLIVDAVRYGYFQARFDHKNNTVHFGGQDLESGACERPGWGHVRVVPRALAV